MIFLPKIIEQLQQRQDEIDQFELRWQTERDQYAGAFERLSCLTSAEMLAVIGAEEAPGALPTAEVDHAERLRVSFSEDFRHHEEARGWAARVLANNPVVAVDGSQIPPSPELPLAAVQAAWFENHHTPDGRYEREIEFELLTPAELQSVGDDGEPDEIINLRRFELELRTLGARIRYLAGVVNEGRLPIGLLDSSLVISFADRLPDEWRGRYVTAMLELLRQAEQLGVPIIGYIDASRSRDLLHLLELASGLPPARQLSDASLLTAHLPWGARTPLMICARGSADRRRAGVLESLAEYRRRIGFVYLRTSASAPPARLEIPLWVWERGYLDRVIDLVRAEVIVGNGYPYAIQSADAAAALSGRDREQFETVVSRFISARGIETLKTAKSISKARRR